MANRRPDRSRDAHNRHVHGYKVAGSRDAAALVSLTPGGYTVRVTGVGGASGLALVEIYDLDSAGSSSRLIIPLGRNFSVGNCNDWGGTTPLRSAFASAGAFTLSNNTTDAAIVVRLPPGGYTVAVSGVGRTTGNALVEIYDLDR